MQQGDVILPATAHGLHVVYVGPCAILLGGLTACISALLSPADDYVWVVAQENAEQAVREMLRRFSEERGLPEVGTVVAEDQMDDGTPIRLSVTIDRRDGSAVFDFAGACAYCFSYKPVMKPCIE